MLSTCGFVGGRCEFDYLRKTDKRACQTPAGVTLVANNNTIYTRLIKIYVLLNVHLIKKGAIRSMHDVRCVRI